MTGIQRLILSVVFIVAANIFTSFVLGIKSEYTAIPNMIIGGFLGVWSTRGE